MVFMIFSTRLTVYFLVVVILFSVHLGLRLKRQPRLDLGYSNSASASQSTSTMAGKLSKMPTITIDGRKVAQVSAIMGSQKSYSNSFFVPASLPSAWEPLGPTGEILS